MKKFNLPHIQLAGRYKLEVRRHGELIHDTGWFDNLITNDGLNALGASVAIGAYVMVGTSNTAPANTDTTLVAQVASKLNSAAPSSSFSSGVETVGNRYGWCRLTCPFAQGAVVGNIAEVGIGWTSTLVFSRSLVTPAISIIAIDQLTVVYELRMYLPTTNVTGTVNIGGTSYNYTIRPARAASTNFAGAESSGWACRLPLLAATARAWVQVPFDPYTAWYGCLTFGAPAALQTDVEASTLKTTDGGATNSPTSLTGNVTTPTNQAYVNNSLRAEFSFAWTIANGNIEGAQVWTSRTSGTASALNGVAFGAGLFVAVGAGGIIYTSPDGITWTSRTSGTANALNAVTWSGSKFVAVGAAGTILSSTDGITWTVETSGSANALNGVTFGGGLFIAVGASGTVLTSPTSVTWTAQTSGTAVILYGVAYGAGAYVAVGATGVIISSPNATGWTSRTSGTASDLLCVAYGLGLFMAAGPSTGFTTRSSDGSSWTTGLGGISASYKGIASTSILMVMVGGALVRSSNGSSWSNVAGTGFNAVAVGAKTFVAVGAAGAVYTSSSGGIQGFIYSGLFGTYQCVLDGVIDKDNTKTLTMTFEQTWARRP